MSICVNTVSKPTGFNLDTTSNAPPSSCSQAIFTVPSLLVEIRLSGLVLVFWELEKTELPASCCRVPDTFESSNS